MKKTFWGLLLCLFSICLSAQTAREEIKADIHRSASNYYAYPRPTGKLTPPPAGYKPFYLSQYARHGSRYQIDKNEYLHPLRTLQMADSAGMLTQLGKKTLMILDSISRMSVGRYGELTPLGARQHHQIAARTIQRYPEIFAGATNVDARSTVVIRCILSMTAECLELQSHNPLLRFHNDASEHDMYYMNYYGNDTRKYRKNKEIGRTNDALEKAHLHPQRLMEALFTDTAYVAKHVKANSLMNQLFDLACNMQSLPTGLDLYPIFNEQEIYDLWVINNYGWYTYLGPSPLGESKLPYIETNLLENFLNTADTCVTKVHPGATLRFGHEVCVLPFACLLELGSCNYQTSDPEQVADHWRNYRIFPMASNVQWVFYRKKGNNDILVKMLLNEEEMTLPLKSNLAPYYHWKDVENYYRKKIADFRKNL